MRLVTRLGIAAVILVAAAALVGLLLPRGAVVERSVEIFADPTETFSFVNHLPHWQQWDPWAAVEPQAERRYSTPPSGNGAYLTWSGDRSGAGTVTLERVRAPEHIRALVAVEGRRAATSLFAFAKTPNGGTAVTWTYDVDYGGSLWRRWAGFLGGGTVVDELERGLAGLKTVAEEYHRMSASQVKSEKSKGSRDRPAESLHIEQ